MALYDGFFDATKDEDTGEYDRAYESGDFTGYFEHVFGSGVCIHDNPDSFLVRLEDGQAVVSPGYLFIRGYWLKNDADYTIDLPGDGTHAIVAHLNLGKRMIELSAQSVAQAYPDSLVLAIVSPASAEDTRYNTDICGVIDTAGELSTKAAWALHYIDTEVESKLKDAEAEIAAQDKKLSEKIADVQAVVDEIAPIPIGTIKFSANPDLGEEWLECDGRFVSKAKYPDLVDILKTTPTGYGDFSEILGNRLKSQYSNLSNGVIFEGRIWAFNYGPGSIFTTGVYGHLYGIDLADGSIKDIEIALNSYDPRSQLSSPYSLSILEFGSIKYLFLSGGYGYLTLNTSTNTEENVHPVVFMFKGFSPNLTKITLTKVVCSSGYNDKDLITRYSLLQYVMELDGDLYVPGPYHANGSPQYGCYLYKLDNLDSDSPTLYGSGPAIYTNTAGMMYIPALSKKNEGFLEIRSRLPDELTSVFIRIYKELIPDNLGTRDFPYPYPPFPGVGISDGNNNIKPNNLNLLGESEALIFYRVSSKKFYLTSIDLVTLDVSVVECTQLNLPAETTYYKDAACYLKGLGIWAFFVGTGVVFSAGLKSPDQFSFMDTRQTLGNILLYGYMEYDEDNRKLCILGQNRNYEVKLGVIQIPDGYNPLDGAWLPNISTVPVPAYIKSKSTESAEEVPA